MPHTRDNIFKRAFRKAAGGRKKQQDIAPSATSANNPSKDSSATGRKHIQHQQPSDSFASTSSASHQQPLAAESLWDQAYHDLGNEMPDLVKDYDELLAKEQMATSNETTSLQLRAQHGLKTRSDLSPRQVQLNTVIHNGLQRMDDNKTTYTIAGHEFVLEDQITKAAAFLLWSKDWLGSAVKDSPEAFLVWAAVCLIFPLLTNPTTAAEANRDGFVYVTSRMRYYVALEPMLRRLGQNDKVDEALISEASDHIVDLYHAILDFQLSSVLRFYQSRLKTYARDIVTPKDWRQTLLDIKTREQTVNSDLGQINQLAARQELDRLNNTSEKTNAAMENYLSVATQHLTVPGEQLTVLKQQQAAQEDVKQERLLAKQQAQQKRLLAEQQRCLQLFYLTQNGNGAGYDWYKGRVQRRVEGTCNWLLQHENFQKWLLQESGPLLVTADPGCGKSVLANYLIDHELAQQSATICYFFFKDQDQNTICQALCALLHQLFSQKNALIQHAMELYNKMGDKLVQSEESLWTILRDAVLDPLAGPVIIVIDALDECAEPELGSLIANLENMFRDQQLANAKLKILMTSRPYQQVVNKFEDLQDEFRQIHIPGEEEFETISQDIKSVIHHGVEQLAKSHRLPDNIKSSLESKLLAIDHRTYLWVHLVFDHIEHGFTKGLKKSEDKIDAAIQTLPESVNEAYDRILSRSHEDGTIETVKKALSIILAARRPLTLTEMNIAMHLNRQSRGRSIYDLDLAQDADFESRLRTLCGLFVNVHHDKIYLLHPTAREFLLQSPASTTASSDLQWKHSITTRHAHSVLAEICMLYLNRLSSTDTETFRQDDQHDALLQYSVEHWGDHFREAEFETGSTMVDLASGLCTPDLTSHSLWASIISLRYHIHPDSSTNVFIASHLGLTAVTELLLSRGAKVQAKDGQGRTALMLAAESGHGPVIRLLLENGADVEERDDDGWTALMHAARSGHEAVTSLLLEKGADIEARDDDGWTALMHAARSGHEAVTSLLLEKGADIEAKDDKGWTASMHAARSGHEAVTSLLLEKGADVEAKDDDGRTALMHAAETGHEFVTRFLLENGADLEARDDSYCTTLLVAAHSGHEVIIRLLLEMGTDIEARDNDGWTALMHAARSGHEAVARLLLEKGADIEARDNDGWTALMHAARSGHEAVARLLLEKGADIDARDEDDWTALLHAARYGHEAVTQVLLERGADVLTRNADNRSALICAARSNHEAVIRLLLEKGADVEARDADGWTALLHAATYGHEAVTWLLLDDGAEMEARDDDGWTALMHAARSNHEAVTRLLLDYGADIEARDNEGYTALMNASSATTRLLLHKGAQVDA